MALQEQEQGDGKNIAPTASCEKLKIKTKRASNRESCFALINFTPPQKKPPTNWELNTKHWETRAGDLREHDRRNPHSVRGQHNTNREKHGAKIH